MATKRLLFSCMVLMALTGSGTALWGQTGGFAYATGGGMGGIVWAYTINGTTGELTRVGLPVRTGAGPKSVTVDPTGRFAYVANGFTNSVSGTPLTGPRAR